MFCHWFVYRQSAIGFSWLRGNDPPKLRQQTALYLPNGVCLQLWAPLVLDYHLDDETFIGKIILRIYVRHKHKIDLPTAKSVACTKSRWSAQPTCHSRYRYRVADLFHSNPDQHRTSVSQSAFMTTFNWCQLALKTTSALTAILGTTVAITVRSWPFIQWKLSVVKPDLSGVLISLVIGPLV